LDIQDYKGSTAFKKPSSYLLYSVTRLAALWLYPRGAPNPPHFLFTNPDVGDINFKDFLYSFCELVEQAIDLQRRDVLAEFLRTISTPTPFSNANTALFSVVPIDCGVSLQARGTVSGRSLPTLFFLPDSKPSPDERSSRRLEEKGPWGSHSP
jgi:hypothetical protein